MKIIPAIDLMEGTVVRLIKGQPEKKTIYSDEPIKIAKVNMVINVSADLHFKLGYFLNKIIFVDLPDNK